MAERHIELPRKVLKRFIRLYKEYPCLWDRRCLAYKQKHKRNEAISQLTKLVQEYAPKATKVHVLRKIESIRACVRRAYNKVQRSMASAKTPDDIYEPRLWYYRLLVFAFDEDGSMKQEPEQESSEDSGDEDPEKSLEQDDDEETAEYLYESDDDYPEQSTTDIEMEPDSPAKRPKHFKEEDKKKKPCIEALDEYTPADSYEPDVIYPEYTSATPIEMVPDSPANRHIPRQIQYTDESKKKQYRTEVDDEYDAIGINVAAKLRGLPSNMRILAEKLINDVLYQAQTNSLATTTTVTTPDPFKT